MNVRKRSGEMTGPVGSAPKNANTSMRSKASQSAPIRNAVNKPKPDGFSRVKNAVSS